jgi:hypothetical protein
MTLRLFVIGIFCLSGLNNSLLAMEQKETFEFVQSSDKQEKIFEDFTHNALKNPHMAATEYDKNHDLVILGSQDGSLTFLLNHKITNLNCEVKRVPASKEQDCKEGITSLSIDENKNLLVVCDGRSSTLDVRNFIKFPQEGVVQSIPIKMASFPAERKTMFRATVITAGIGLFGLYIGEQCITTCYAYSKLLSEKNYVTAVDALKINNGEFIILFGCNFGYVQIIHWKVQEAPQLLELCNLTSKKIVEKVIIDKETQKIGFKSQSHEPFSYIDFPESLKKLLS